MNGERERVKEVRATQHNMITMIYIYIYIHGAFNKFPDVFVQACKIVVDFWKFSILLLYILWDDWLIFMISGSNKQIQQELEYTLLKPDCHSWGILKMQSGCEDTLEERYAIKFCFKLGKNATETYGMLQTAFRLSCMNRALVFEWHKICGGARGVIVIVLGNEHGDTSSNPGRDWLHFTLH